MKGDLFPTYTDLGVTPPGTTATCTVPTSVEACELQVDPVPHNALSSCCRRWRFVR
ncbi:MAG: hypothetical protein QOG75_5738 [Mycobacterium sp.]|nr:hypothetical protein [Mycobacterium sp.]